MATKDTEDVVKGITVEQACAQGYIGTSPARERTGLADKGLSQANPAVMNRPERKSGAVAK